MIIVSNTSPLTNLAAIGRFDLLGHLYSGLIIAEGVWDELNAGGRYWPGRNEVATADWIQRRTVRNQPLVNALRRDLDRAGVRFKTLWNEKSIKSNTTARSGRWGEKRRESKEKVLYSSSYVKMTE